MKKVLFILLSVVVIAGGLYAYTSYRGRQQAQAALASVATEELQTGSLDQTISATGKVRTRQTATLLWETSGTVESVNVGEGDLVASEDILATLEQTSLPQDVLDANTELATAKQSLEDLKTDAETAKVTAMQNIVTYEAAVKDAQYALDNYTVPSSIAGMDAVEAVSKTKEVLDQARAGFEPYKYQSSGNTVREQLRQKLDNAQADYNSAVARLEYEYALEVAEANLAKAKQDYDKWKDGPVEADVQAIQSQIAAAEATLKMAWVEAPFTGTITLADVQTGDQVTAGTTAFRMDNLETLYVDLEVSEIDIQQIQTGQKAVITFDALQGKEYHGEVVKVAMVSTEDSDVVNFQVTVSLTDADENVRSGMTAEVEITTAHVENAVLIPNEAILSVNDSEVIYIRKAGAGTVPVEITTGISSETDTELVSGEVAPGDVVILNPNGSATETEIRGGMMFGGMMGGGRPPEGERPRSGNSGGAPAGGQP